MEDQILNEYDKQLNNQNNNKNNVAVNYNQYANLANDYAKQAYEAQKQAIQLGVDKTASDIEYQKELAKQDELKEAKSAYTDYAKQINPYGVESEAIAKMGLAGSGYQESSKINMNNTYQNRVSQAVDTTRRLFADYNNKMNEAKANANIQMAQALQQQYQNQIENLWRDFELQYQMNRDQKEDDRYERQWQYQLSRDEANDNRYEKEWQHQLDREKVNDDRYNQEWQYQMNRDAVSDNRYNQEWMHQLDREKVSDDRYNQEWEYQKQRDEIADNRYLTEWERQLALDRLDEEWRQKQFDYQASRDSIADSQWQAEYNLQKKKLASSGSGSSSKSSNTVNNTVSLNDNTSQPVNKYTLANNALSSAEAISNVTSLRSMSDSDFQTYIYNAYKNNQITKEEAEQLIKLRGV